MTGPQDPYTERVKSYLYHMYMNTGKGATAMDISYDTGIPFGAVKAALNYLRFSFIIDSAEIWTYTEDTVKG